jgi:menaquinone-9 beta-reductase
MSRGLDHDVAVVGASLAGCTAATLLARAGLRVALIERHRDLGAFKPLCTHHVMACATPTLRRLGLDGEIEAAGGIRNAVDGYTPWGWVTSPPGVPHGYSIRREKLDPLCRRLAAETPGVELLSGHRATALLDRDGTVDGVRVRGTDGRQREVRARLVVGADGAHSTVARLAGATERTAPNERFCFFAHFTGVELTSEGHTQFWGHEDDIAYAMPNDDGVTILAAMPTKERLRAFQVDREASLLAALRRLPDGPGLETATRVSKLVGFTDYPLVDREAVPAPGVALIGDASLTSDPSQGVGCGWAFQSAEWLADAVTPALRDGRPLAPALRRYRRSRAPLKGHHSIIADEATARPPTRLDRLMLTAGVHDETMAAHVMAYFNRTIPVRRFLGPAALARAAWVTGRTRHAPDHHDRPDRQRTAA